MIRDTAYYAVKTFSVLLTTMLIMVSLFFGYIFYCNHVGMDVPTLGSFKMYLVLSDSMAPVMHEGDAIIITSSPQPGELEPDDIITFFAFGGDVTITHRITYAESTPQGYVFHTMGDNNSDPDPFTTPQDRVIGRYIVRIPNFAGFLQLSESRPHFIAMMVGVVVVLQFAIDALQKILKPKETVSDGGIEGDAGDENKAEL